MSSENNLSDNNDFLDDLTDMAESVIYAVFIVLLVFTFLFRIATVDGSSMEPTLSENDRLVVTNLGYQAETGDIVIIDSNDAYLFSDELQTELVKSSGLGKRIVKRIIACEGQTIDIDFKMGTVYIDGVQIYESYIADLTTMDEGAFEYPLTVPEGYVFVMGDNRLRSKDSRHPEIGLVNAEDIAGQVILRISPFERFGIIY